MRLIHYSEEKFELEPREYDQKRNRWQAKPNGLWFSVEGKYDWKSWCLVENFEVPSLFHSYEIVLKPHSRILLIKTQEELFEFTKAYPLRTLRDADDDTHQLNWMPVRIKYQGIIIAPYRWDCRLHMDSSWYYGWDCASGCIWDLDAIEKFTYLGYEKVAPEE